MTGALGFYVILTIGRLQKIYKYCNRTKTNLWRFGRRDSNEYPYFFEPWGIFLDRLQKKEEEFVRIALESGNHFADTDSETSG